MLRYKKYICVTSAVIFLSVSGLCTVSLAQDEQKVITKVEVQGNKNISGATVLSKVRTRKGAKFSQMISSDDLKRLYALGYFTDINIEIEDTEGGIAVTFYVVEKPIIKKIIISGNKSIKTEKLQVLLKSKPEAFLNIQQLKQDMRDIQKAYEGRGFPLVGVNYELKTDEETNESDVEIIIEEKARVRIADIKIKGNKKFKDKKILKLMRTRRDTLFTSGIYREKVLDLDLERIVDFYYQKGYLDVKVEFEKSFGEKKKKMYLVITVNEGKQYLVGEIKIEGAVVFPEAEIKSQVDAKLGRIFTKEQLRYDVSNIQSFYFAKGYISAEVDAATVLNDATGKIDIVYKIIENDLAYIDKIKIRGNTKTRDIVVRRELRSYPGEAFDGQKLKRSKERLYNLGFFQEISYDTQDTAYPKKKDLIVNVTEAKTGEFAFGAGFSSVERMIGFVEVAQRNFDITNWSSFTGAGQDLRAKAEFGTNHKEYDLTFTEPWIFGYPLSLGIDLYNRFQERSGTTGYSYDEERRGTSLRLGKELTELVRADLIYRLEAVDISNVPDAASQDLRDELGEKTTSSLLLSLTRDSRDSIYNPSKGLVVGLSSEVAGGALGQDKDFFKIISTVDYFKTLRQQLLLELKVVAAAGDSYGDSTSLPVYERFYAGGTNTIRGFEERVVGPKDISGEPVGGESTLYGTCELTYPLFKLIKVATFYDFGNVWQKIGDFASGDMKYSIGLGVRVKTPMGPVKLDYGYPLKVAAGETEEGRFHFSMTRGF